MSQFSKSFLLKREADTLSMGRILAPHLGAGDTLALRGELGAGKTTLARGIIRAICGAGEVPSPTYTLVQVYETPKGGELWHGDMYRLEQPEACLELGLEDAFLDAICVIEWPDNLGPFLPQNVINVTLSFDGMSRRIDISGEASWIKNLEQP